MLIITFAIVNLATLSDVLYYMYLPVRTIRTDCCACFKTLWYEFPRQDGYIEWLRITVSKRALA
jgi:hypothetical protein